MNQQLVANLLSRRRRAGLGVLGGVAVAAAAAMMPGCLDRPIERVEPRTTTTIIERLTQDAVERLDLLLMIDSSGSMADKQQILQLAVPDLIDQLVNPRCGITDDSGAFVPAPAAEQPAGPLEPCPVKAHKREFEPVLDIHVGIITSSLGGHGADACNAGAEPTQNDGGRLVYRADTEGGGNVPTWQDLGFLAWDPCAGDSSCEPRHDPPGEADVKSLIENLATMVAGTGEAGCGYEATLESWYRFLIEPDPYETIELQDDRAVPRGTDETLLRQRADFLRPDSLLAILMLSDENDCSIRDGGQHYLVAQQHHPGTSTPFHLPKPQAGCATDPNGPCCRSCGQPAAEGCPAKGAECDGAIDPLDDDFNLRCYDQKRRFGIDFLYPIDRYVTGLSSPSVQDRHGNLVANPLFMDLSSDDQYSNVRDAGRVFLAGIVGVPWQDIARKDAAGNPDLLAGLDDDGNPVGGFQSAAELARNGTWDVILGEPSEHLSCSEGKGACPADPLMIESVEPRSGTHPITGEPIGLPPADNSISGHERSIERKNDLQYACTFPLQSPRDCTNQAFCDCSEPDNNNPLCESPPGTFGQIQHLAKAYPGIRELHALRELGDQGIVASICPAQQTDTKAADFGYRPAIGAVIERLKEVLKGQCLPRTLTPDPQGQVACLIIEARPAGGQCDCTGNGRSPVKQEHLAAVEAAQAEQLAASQGWGCFCEISQALGEDLEACQSSLDEPVVNARGEEVHGWCYVDATTFPPTGNPAIVASCPANQQRLIRFVGDGGGVSGATLFITCAGE